MVTVRESQLIAAIVSAIAHNLPKLCQQQSRGRAALYSIDRKTNPLTGHCFLAAQALWVLLSRENGWGLYAPYVISSSVDGVDTHWYVVRLADGCILDPTASQFDSRIPYELGVNGTGGMCQHLRYGNGTAQLWHEHGIFTPNRKAAALIEALGL